jgi:DNA processing protein
MALIGLAHCVEPADPTIGRLVEAAGAQMVLADLRSGRGRLRHAEGIRARLDASGWEGGEERAHAAGARVVTRLDREWPSQLDDLGPGAPFALWVVGAADLRLACLRSVAMVGARACSAYGEEIARYWSAELAGQSWTVVSGGAFGIDAAAHRGALAADGLTVCVQAGGVDRPYPRAHEALVARLVDNGLVVSESPLGEAVRRQRFLSRNRVIAALTRATVVVEAAERSGTIATARAAGGMCRPVLAVPGPVTSPASAGCHRMIRDGEALLVASAAEVLDLLDLRRLGESASAPTATRGDPTLARVLDAMPAMGTSDFDHLLAATALDATSLTCALVELAARGRVRVEPSGWRLVR